VRRREHGRGAVAGVADTGPQGVPERDGGFPLHVVEVAVAAGQRQPVRLDYLALTDPKLGPVTAQGEARLLVAAAVGSTRLIDNVPVLLGTAAKHATG